MRDNILTWGKSSPYFCAGSIKCNWAFNAMISWLNWQTIYRTFHISPSTAPKCLFDYGLKSLMSLWTHESLTYIQVPPCQLYMKMVVLCYFHGSHFGSQAEVANLFWASHIVNFVNIPPSNLPLILKLYQIVNFFGFL